MKRIGIIIASALLLLAGFSAGAQSVNWTATVSGVDEHGEAEIIFSANMAEGYHIYDVSDPYSAPLIEFTRLEGCTPTGELYAKGIPASDSFGSKIFEGSVQLAQKIKISSTEGKFVAEGVVNWVACKGHMCGSPEEWEFSISSAAPAPAGKAEGNLWGLVIEAILWGFAMLLTPCVFPMIPMTVSFFLKNGAAAAGRFKAIMYGVFIILLYTVPISIIIGMTWLIGGEAVTADIFNWLSTHWIPNVIFFAVFLIFALSFFGAFEIVLPSKLVGRSDAKSDKKGLAGVFFMALTLVLVSFSCTGPIVGTVLIKSTQGEFWTPMVTMLAFSAAFALGFTLFALFPTILKSGPWLNSVKVVFGFLELAFGLKFLSVADQTYHWHLLDREVYLAIWIVIFALLGFYLLGKIRFKYDEKVDHIGITRLGLAIASFAFTVYMIPGMWGAPLKGISGYLPPLETQDFIMGQGAAGPKAAAASRYDLRLPLGLDGYFTVEEGLEAAKAQNKPVLIDITGHGCVNCREMEQRVLSDEKVLGLLRDKFIVVALYTDDKTSLPESEWLTTKTGKVLKDLGRVNSYIVRERFGVAAQPNYTILDTEGRQLVPVRGYDLSVDGYAAFLQQGLDAFYNK